jgi:hypothetical protein
MRRVHDWNPAHRAWMLRPAPWLRLQSGINSADPANKGAASAAGGRRDTPE